MDSNTQPLIIYCPRAAAHPAWWRPSRGSVLATRPARRFRSSIPDEEHTDFPGKAAREVEHPRGQVKVARLQIAFPSQVHLGGLAAQGLGPVWQRRVDRPATVCAQIGWETKQHQLFLAMCGRLAGMVQDRAPAFVGDVVVDELLDAVVTLLRRGPAHLLPMFDIVMLEIGGQCSEICYGQASLCGRGRRRLVWWACGYGIALMTELGIDRTDDLADHPRPPGD